MKTYNYLYDIDKPIWTLMQYNVALETKVDLGKTLLRKLNKVSYMEADNARINEVMKAIEFNKALILEGI